MYPLLALEIQERYIQITKNKFKQMRADEIPGVVVIIDQFDIDREGDVKVLSNIERAFGMHYNLAQPWQYIQYPVIGQSLDSPVIELTAWRGHPPFWKYYITYKDLVGYEQLKSNQNLKSFFQEANMFSPELLESSESSESSELSKG